MKVMYWLAVSAMVAATGGLLGWRARVRHETAIAPLWDELARPAVPGAFDPAMVEGLPAPVQRYLRHAIAPGAPLATSVQLTMHGRMRLKPGAEPMPMQAEQVLAPPRGLVWKARVGRGLMRIEGFDRYGHGEGAMRWWLYGLVPVVTADGPDVSRSAAGRVAGEAILVPAALLPQHGAVWEAVDDATARVTLRVDDEVVTFTLSVDPVGRPQRVSIRRWKGDTRAGAPGYDRFDVDGFAGERTFDGYTIPTRFRAGWRLGEPDAFAFFHAEIDTAAYR